MVHLFYNRLRLHRVLVSLERTVITVNGQPKVVILSIDELESLEETAEVLSTIPGIKKDIEESRRQIKKGQFTPLSKLK